MNQNPLEKTAPLDPIKKKTPQERGERKAMLAMYKDFTVGGLSVTIDDVNEKKEFSISVSLDEKDEDGKVIKVKHEMIVTEDQINKLKNRIYTVGITPSGHAMLEKLN